jgi:hypothetical protein
MGALFYLEERIKAVRNVIDNSIATTSPIIEEAVSSTLLETYSEMKVEEEILTFINNQISTNIFLRKSQLNIDLIIPKCVSEEEKNLEPVERSRQWCQDSLNIFFKEEATVQIWASAECSFAFSIEDRGRNYFEYSAAYQLTVKFYQLRSTIDYRTGGRQRRREAAKSNADLPSNLATYWKDVVQDSGVK